MRWFRRRRAGSEPAETAMDADNMTGAGGEETAETLAVPTGRWRDHLGTVPPDRHELADELDGLVGVERSSFDERAWMVLLFDDVRVAAGDPAIEALEDSLAGQDGVESAVFHDRELLEVKTALEPAALHGLVVARLAATASSGV